MEILGYIGAIAIGLVLGLTGGGGSILTVPILVYLMKMDPVPATAYSLFIVGLTALIGSFTFMKKKEVSFLTAAIFAVPAFTAVYLTRRLLVPALPEVFFSIGTFSFSKNLFVMTLFAVLMLASSITMIKDKRPSNVSGELSYNIPLIILEAFVVGILTGLVGAGGGFLIIPALVILARLPMKMAVGTSLLIIAVNSLIGFLGDVGANLVVNWQFLFSFSVLTITGIIAGSYLSKFISNEKLKPAFGWFVMVMGVYIIIKEFYTRF